MVRLAERDQMPAAVQDQPERLGEVLELDLPQPAGMGGRDRDRAGVVLVGLATRLARQLAGSVRERGRHVHDLLASQHQLLGQQRPSPLTFSTAQIRSGQP
jgi:hypothetical protein